MNYYKVIIFLHSIYRFTVNSDLPDIWLFSEMAEMAAQQDECVRQIKWVLIVDMKFEYIHIT